MASESRYTDGGGIHWLHAASAFAALVGAPPPARVVSRQMKRGKNRCPSYTKKGPGRCHRSGAPKEPYRGTAVQISPERQLLYMHSLARQFECLRRAAEARQS